VTKTIATLDGSDVTPETPGIDRAGMLVFNDGPGRIEDRNGDFLTTHPLRVVSVRNEFSLIPRAAGPVTLQAVNTFFTVPEPAAPFVLAAAAAAGLARRRGRGLPERRAV